MKGRTSVVELDLSGPLSARLVSNAPVLDEPLAQIAGSPEASVFHAASSSSALMPPPPPRPPRAAPARPPPYTQQDLGSRAGTETQPDRHAPEASTSMQPEPCNLSDLIAKVASGRLVPPKIDSVMLVMQQGRIIQQMREMVAAILRIDIVNMGSEIVPRVVARIVKAMARECP